MWPTLFFMEGRRKIWLAITAGLLLGLASAWLRFQALAQTPYANGWDGYFYLVQVKAWVETGRMHSPEASLIYPLLRFFYWCTGDYVLMYQCCAAALAGAFAAVVAWTARSWAQGWLLGGWALFSPHLTYFAAQYPKNLLGMVLLLAFIGSLPRQAAQQRPARFILPFILLVVNYFGHRLTFGLAMVYLLCWTMVSVKTLFWRRIFNRKNIAVGAVAIGLFVAASSVFPGLLHVADLGRLAGGWQWRPQFAPWSFISQLGEGRLSNWWWGEIVVITGLFLFAWTKTIWDTRRGAVASSSAKHYALLLLCILLLFPFLEWSFTGVAYRFFLGFVLLVPGIFGEGGVARNGTSLRQPAIWWRYVAGTLLGLAAFFSWKSYVPTKHDPNYALFDRITSRATERLGLGSTQPPELVIAHNALAEYFTFTTDVDAMPWLPEYAIDSARLWRMAGGMHLPTVRYFAGAGQAARVQPLSTGYCLLPEWVWQRSLAQARIEGDSVYLALATSWLNPGRERPGWLLNKKR